MSQGRQGRGVRSRWCGLSQAVAVLILAGMFTLPPAAGWTQDFVDFATMSPTAPNVANRLCYTDGTDLACDGAAGLVTTSGTLQVSGISATGGYFAGDVGIGDPSAITSGAKTLRVYSDGPSTSALGIAAIEIESVNNNALLTLQNSWNGTGGTQAILHGDGGIRLTRPTDATSGDVNGYIDFSVQNLDYYARFQYNASAGLFYLMNTSSTAKLFVQSSVRVGNDTGLCDGNNPGTIRYNAGTLQVCNGSSWGSVGSGTETGDRISSTNNLAAVVAMPDGRVSFTLEGVAGRAYLDSTLGLVAPGVSATGGISGTTGYFAGNVGIGVAPSATTTNGAKTLRVYSDGPGTTSTLGNAAIEVESVNRNSSLILAADTAASKQIIFRNGGTEPVTEQGVIVYVNNEMTFTVSSTKLVTISSTPTPRMEIYGTASATEVQVGAGTTAGNSCNTSQFGTIRRNATTGRVQVCRPL